MTVRGDKVGVVQIYIAVGLSFRKGLTRCLGGSSGMYSDNLGVKATHASIYIAEVDTMSVAAGWLPPHLASAGMQLGPLGPISVRQGSFFSAHPQAPLPSKSY